MAGNEIEIVVTSTDATGAGFDSARAGAAGVADEAERMGQASGNAAGEVEHLGESSSQAGGFLDRVTASQADFVREATAAAGTAEEFAQRVEEAGTATGALGSEAGGAARGVEEVAQGAEGAAGALGLVEGETVKTETAMSRLSAAGGILRDSLNQTPGILNSIGIALGVIAPLLIGGGAALTAFATGGAVLLLGLGGVEQVLNQLDAGFGILKSSADSALMKTAIPAVNEINKVLPEFRTGVTDIANGMGGLVKSFADFVSSAQGIQMINAWLEGTAQFFQEGKAGVTALAQAWNGFLAGAAPAMAQLGDAVSAVFVDFNNMITEANKSGEITQAVAGAAPVFQALGDVLTAIVKVFLDISAGAGPSAAKALEAIAQAITDAGPAITMFVKGFSDAITVIANILNLLGGFKDPFTYITGALVAIGIGFGIFTTLLAPIGKFIEVLKSLAIALGLVEVAEEGVAGAEGAGLIATALGALAGPVGIVIGVLLVLAGIAALIIANWGPISDFFGQMFDKIGGYLGRFGDGWDSAWSAIGDAVKAPVNAIIVALNLIIDAINLVMKGLNALSNISQNANYSPDLIPAIPTFATGGIGSGLALVGENGPELVNLPGGSSISSNSSMSGAMGGGGDGLGGGGQLQLTVAGGTDQAVATMFMQLVRSGKLVVRHQGVH